MFSIFCVIDATLIVDNNMATIRIPHFLLRTKENNLGNFIYSPDPKHALQHKIMIGRQILLYGINFRQYSINTRIF